MFAGEKESLRWNNLRVSDANRKDVVNVWEAFEGSWEISALK